ncbi:MAG: CpaF/VirB11 family protein [Propionibacteriaceae bacterium]|nr:CpaF/VirB11 family protein [Propionibacteriaceae bacterium]
MDLSLIDPHRVAVDDGNSPDVPLHCRPGASVPPTTPSSAHPVDQANVPNHPTSADAPPVKPPSMAYRFGPPPTQDPIIPAVEHLWEVPWANATPVDWGIVAQMRTAASARLSNRIGSDHVDTVDQQHLGRIIIADLLDERASEAIAQGLPGWDPTIQARMGQAVFDSLFRLGRLQTLVDDESIENIIISGADNVWIETSSGSMVKGPPVADSDQELIDFLSFIAARSEVNERSFSPAEPRLHMRLDSGARLAAAAWVTPRPSVVIRRHRLEEVTLADLVARETFSPQMSLFLAAAVHRRASIVVSGAQGAGKTTLVRALCSEIPADEVIGTFETEYELHLHLMPKRHPVVHAWEARPGSGETDAAGRRAGEFTLDDALYDSFRFNLSRQIVGEVRGPEILAMLKAMQSGSGSLSTTHAHSAEGAIRKLITCAMEAGPHVTSQYATRAVAEDIDFIVHMEMINRKLANGQFRRHRWVKEILSVQPSDSARGYATTRLFSTLPGERVAGMETMPEGYLDVFDPVEELWTMSWP